MNTKTKKRLIVVSGTIIIILILALSILGSNSAAKASTIAEAAEGDLTNQKIQVSGNVVENSFETFDNILRFSIYDPEGDERQHLRIHYEGGVSATFGNNVTAICTGRIGEDGILHASELVTKCPSKYENASNALGVAQLFGYEEEVIDKLVKVTGTVQEHSLKAAGQGDRLILIDQEGTEEISIVYDGALSEEIHEGSVLIVTGSLNSSLKFMATDVALKG